MFNRFKRANANGVEAFHRVRRHPAFAIPFVTGLVIMLLAVVAIIIFSGGKPKLRPTDVHTVVITHDRTEQVVPTRAKTVAEVIKRFDIKVREGDVVEPELDTEIVTDNFRINVYRAVPVTIVDGGRKLFAYSAATTPRSIIKQAGLEVYPEDKLDLLPAENFLVEGSIGQRLVIERATPVNVNIYGTPVRMRALSKTVGQLLDERGLKLGSNDTVQPERSTALTANMQIYLLRKGQKVTTEEVAIPMPQEVIQDNSLTFGTQALRQSGAPGKKVITYLIEVQNGKEERRILQEIVVQEPVKHIVAKGKAVQIPSDKQAVMAAAGIAPSDYPYVDYIIGHENASWCPTRWQGTNGCPLYYSEKYPGAESDRTLGYGLCQSTPANKMASAGSDWRTNVVTQMKWCSSYAKGRYGTWEAAYNYWQSHRNW